MVFILHTDIIIYMRIFILYNDIIINIRFFIWYIVIVINIRFFILYFDIFATKRLDILPIYIDIIIVGFLILHIDIFVIIRLFILLIYIIIKIFLILHIYIANNIRVFVLFIDIVAIRRWCILQIYIFYIIGLSIINIHIAIYIGCWKIQICIGNFWSIHIFSIIILIFRILINTDNIIIISFISLFRCFTRQIIKNLSFVFFL